MHALLYSQHTNIAPLGIAIFERRSEKSRLIKNGYTRESLKLPYIFKRYFCLRKTGIKGLKFDCG